MRLKSRLWLICASLVVSASFSTLNAQFFTRVTDAGAIVTDAFFSSGASWTDINDDGWPDLYALGETTIRFYLNNKNGTFSSSTTGEHFVTSRGVANIGIWADYDNDGYRDLFLGNTTTQPGGNIVAPNFLYRNEGPPLHSMTVVDIGNGINASPSASWIDYDQDGDVDLFSAGAATSNGSGTPDLFYRNDGNSIFVQLEDLSLLKTRAGTGTHDVWIDYDNDSDQDLFVLNWASPNELYKSLLVERGNPKLFQTVSSNGLLDDGSFFDISPNWGDYDNDGNFDVFIAFTNNTNDRVYHNNRNGTFTQVMTGPMVSNATSTSFGVWGDYDNDGDLDLFVARVGLNPTQPALYRNEGGGQFVAMSQSDVGDILVGIPGPQAGSWGDYDNDGDLDLYVLTYANPNRSTGQSDSQELNPAWTYTSAIRTRLPVKLTVSNGANSSELLREDYIEVGLRPDTHVDTQRLSFRTPANVSRIDTSFYVYNEGRGADSVFVSISDYGAADNDAVLVSPESFELAPGDSVPVSFTVLPPLLTVRSYVTRIRIRSKYNSGVQDFDKTIIFTIDAPTAIEQKDEGLPKVFDLLQNHPNPFNSSTSIRFDLPISTHVVMKIYNIRGQEIATLVNSEQTAGRHSAQWDGKDLTGRSVSTGIYVYRIQTDRRSKTRKLLLLK